MKTEIKVNISIEEFTIAGVDIDANYSDENIAKLMKLKDSDISKRAEVEAEKLKSMDEEDMTAEEFEKLIDLCLDLYSEIYEPVFGKDAFKRLYKKVQSINATIRAFEDCFDYITEKIERENNEYREKRLKKINKYKNRKKK